MLVFKSVMILMHDVFNNIAQKYFAIFYKCKQYVFYLAKIFMSIPRD